jgi:hypothetical protein
VIANKYCNPGKALFTIPVAAYCKRALLVYANSFGLYRVAKSPAVVKVLSQGPNTQGFLKITKASKELIDLKSRHLEVINLYTKFHVQEWEYDEVVGVLKER